MKTKNRKINVNDLIIACNIIKKHQSYDHQDIININFNKEIIIMDDRTEYEINKCIDEWMFIYH